MHVRHFVALVVMGTLAITSHAGKDGFASFPSLTQEHFRLLSADLGGALSSKLIAPPTPLGLSGPDLGFKASDSGREVLYTPRIHLHKGLPFGFGVGASYGTVPGHDLHLIGAEARYALVPSSMVLPTIGLRASYSTLKGSNWLDVNARGIDLSVSKGFSLVTPYAGIGSIWVDSTPYESNGLAPERFHQDKYFVGANFTLRMMDLAVEADRTGDATSYRAKFGWRW